MYHTNCCGVKANTYTQMYIRVALPSKAAESHQSHAPRRAEIYCRIVPAKTKADCRKQDAGSFALIGRIATRFIPIGFGRGCKNRFLKLSIRSDGLPEDFRGRKGLVRSRIHARSWMLSFVTSKTSKSITQKIILRGLH